MMQIQDEYRETRLVTCENPPCSFDDDLELYIVSYGLDEIAEWECPACGSMNDYRNDLTGDLEDMAYDRRREGW